MKLKFYRCRHCGNIISHLYDSGVRVVCCGEQMAELVANTVEASVEKHLPVVEIEENKVTVRVGSVEHPMTEEHHIAWIVLQTEKGNQRKILKAGEKPEACFKICCGDKVIAAYEYCNLHGLWKTEVK